MINVLYFFVTEPYTIRLISMNLRPYQQKLVDSVESHFRTNNSIMMQLSTGGGKSYTAGSIIKNVVDNGGRAMILAHRIEIIKQLHNSLIKLGVPAGVISPGYPKTPNLPVQVGSVQTYNRRDDWKCDLLCYDEAHHSPSKTYVDIRDRHIDAKYLGITATPYRLNGRGFGDMFETITCGPSTLQLEQDLHLCPADAYSNPLDPNSLRQIGTLAGDYDEGMLAEFMESGNITADIVEEWKERALGKRTIVFAVNVKHSKSIAERFNKAGIKAVHLDADSKDRDMIIRQFLLGNIKVLCNVAIATEGTDIPGIECVIVARPTKSLSLWLQMTGRGSRTVDGKLFYILLDFANNILEHGLPNEEHDWESHFWGTAKKKGKNKRDMLMKVTLDDGEQMVMSLEEVEDAFPQGMKGIRLQRIDGVFRIALFNECLMAVSNMGLKKGNAYFRFCEVLKERGSVPNYMELLAISKKLGYKKDWALYEANAWERVKNNFILQ